MLLLQRGAKFLAQKPYYYLVIPFFLWFIGTQYAALNFYRDPSSRYFDIRRAYDRVYTQYRTAEAASFIEQANDKPFHRNATNNPDLCVGMLTLARPSGDIYFRNAMGSLLAGLSQEERDAIHLMPFITHTDPSQHPVYGEPWLENVADKVLGYNVTKHMTEEKVNHTKELEQERERTGVPDREKHMADYTYLIRACLEHNPKYVVMLEDDVVAIDGWFHRTMAAIQEVERQTQLAGEKDCKPHLPPPSPPPPIRCPFLTYHSQSSISASSTPSAVSAGTPAASPSTSVTPSSPSSSPTRSSSSPSAASPSYAKTSPSSSRPSTSRSPC